MTETLKAPDLSLSSKEFITFSINNPARIHADKHNSVAWSYRVGGPEDTNEAVFILPSIYETTHTSYCIGSRLIEQGFRVIVASIPPYEKIPAFIKGLNDFLIELLVTRVHFVGIGYGGFLLMHACNKNAIQAAEVNSLTLISSFMTTRCFRSSGGFFSSALSKSDLIDELSPDRMPAQIQPSTRFIIEVMDRIDSDVIDRRISLRSSVKDAPIPSFGDDRTLVIQPRDWAVKLTNNQKPNKVIPNAKVSMLKVGGFFPHLVVPDEICDILVEHIKSHQVVIPEAQIE